MSRPSAHRTSIWLAAACLLATQPGCLNLVANLAHAVGADKIPAEYEGLKEQRVAVITLSEASQFKEDRSARTVSRRLAEILDQEVRQIDLVREEEIEDWRDRNGWDQTDFLAIGQGVGANKIVAIELVNLRLREGPNLYRGHADVTIRVLDAETGDTEYRKTLEDYTFPRNAAQDATSTSESKFRRMYLEMLARKIARSFHPYDLNEDFALDGAIASY